MILPGDPLALPAGTGASVLLHETLRVARDDGGVIRRRPPALLLHPFGDCEAAERLLSRTAVADAEVFVLRLPDALLAGQRAFVTAAPHRLVTDSRDPGHRASIYEATERRRFESVRLDHDADGFRLPAGDAPPVRVEEEAVALTGMEGGNYGAFLLRCVNKLVAVRQVGLGGLRVIAGHRPWQAAAWAAFGIPPEQVIAHDLARSHAVRSLIVPSLRAPHFFLDDPAAALFRDLAERLRDGAARPEKVYVSRLSLDRRRPGYRACANEAALVERVRAMGFHVVEPQSLPFEEQVRTFAAARIVVGPGGAGMFNTVFCRPGTAVVSVESTTNWLAAHANLFASLGHDYALVVGGADPAGTGQQRPWQMDVDCVVGAVSRMMGQGRSALQSRPPPAR